MALPASQQKILEQMKNHGALTVRVLARRLAITTMGVRQHLAEMESAGMVEKTAEVRQNRGRPVHRWQLTPEGHRRFPDGHQRLCVDLLGTILHRQGEASLADLVDSHGAGILQRYQAALAAGGDDNLEQRLRALAGLRSEDGYMAEVRLLPAGNWLLIENHCPIAAAAQACPGFCRAEQDLFARILGPGVALERTDHLLNGDRRCAYRISPMRRPED